ncbi:MAG: DUF4340 domain-containing protein [Acidobacteriota bacterium]
MRGFRSTIVLLVIFLGLIGYIYFYESKRPSRPDEGEPKQKVFAVESGRIEEITVKSGTGDPTVLKKTDGTWQIAAPVMAAADQNEATGLATNLATLDIQRVIDENPQDLVQYGLAAPRIEIGFRTADDKAFRSIQFGDKTATGADLYAKLPSETRVFLVSGYLESTFSRTTFDLRDKTILKFERDATNAMEIVAMGAATEFAKSGTDWRLTSPIDARADATTVDGLIGRLHVGQMKSIAAADVAGPDLAQYGLDEPGVSVSLTAGSSRATLVVGKEADSGSYYARDASRTMVFTVETSLVDDLKKEASAYRPKDVFDFRPYSASRIEVVRDGTQVAFERKKNTDGADTWHRLDPAGDVDVTKVDAFLASLSGLSVDSYVDARTATGTEVARIFVTFDDGKKQERVTFSRLGSDAFAVRPGDPGAGRFAASRLDEAMKALDALK